MQTQQAASSHARCVLVIDDDIDIREALGEVLAAERYLVTTAENGEEALSLMRLGLLPKVILLDLMMPVMDGVRFRELQLQDPAFAGIPVVLITASGNARAKAKALGISEALDKPVDIDDLLVVLSRYQ